jgi:hypothetical protein
MRIESPHCLGYTQAQALPPSINNTELAAI